jgi:photosystem II stability/assembly factor-like uncharacterized protein
VYKSVNGGVSWKRADNGISDEEVKGLVVDPTDQDDVYCILQYATATDDTLFQSTNGGASWNPVLPFHRRYVGALIIDRSHPRTRYVAGAGLFKSVDGGRSWTGIGGGVFDNSVLRALAVDPSDSRTLYAAMSPGPVLRSTDGGMHWKPINVGFISGTSVDVLAAAPTTPTTVYAGAGGSGLFAASFQ